MIKVPLILSLLLILNSTELMAHISTQVDSYIQKLVAQQEFSGVILIAQQGNPIFHTAYGFANHEWEIPCTLDTKFRIASITKQFTAAAILKLQEQGLLKLTDTVDKYIPDYPQGNRITIHHLLSHTAGLARIFEIPHLNNVLRVPHTTGQMVELFKNKPLIFNPGSYYDYSNSGYLLLSHIIEIITGKSFAYSLKELILIPADMHESGNDDNTMILKKRASGYILINDTLCNGEYIEMQLCAGAGGIYSCAADLLRWNQALYSGKIITPESLTYMLTPYTISLSAFPGGCELYDLSYANYGYGIRTGIYSNGTHFTSHEGILNGFITNMIHMIEPNIDIVILSNFQHAPIKEITGTLANYITL